VKNQLQFKRIKNEEITVMTGKIIRDLGEGIIIRHGTRADEQALVDFTLPIHSEGEWDEKGLEA
jgi:hypothetical protein